MSNKRQKDNKPDGVVVGVLVIATLLILLFASISKINQAVRSPAAIADATSSEGIVRLVGPRGTFCTGVVLNSNTIATAAHCMVTSNGFFMEANTAPVEIRRADNQEIGVTGRLATLRLQIDQATLRGDFSSLTPRKYITKTADLVRETRVKDRRFIMCGYPLGGEFFCTPAVYLRDEAFFLAVRGVLIPGMSGGPTMLEDGTVVALNYAVTEDHSVVSPLYGIDDKE